VENLRRSGNVYENKGTYPFNAGMLLKIRVLIMSLVPGVTCQVLSLGAKRPPPRVSGVAATPET
jgi:hypothetical protein